MVGVPQQGGIARPVREAQKADRPLGQPAFVLPSRNGPITVNVRVNGQPTIGSHPLFEREGHPRALGKASVERNLGCSGKCD